MVHDLALESHLGAMLREVGSLASRWQDLMPLAREITNVVPLDELGDPQDRMPLANPLALYFGFGDELEESSAGEGAAQRWSQDWWVVVAARHVGKSTDVNLLRDLAGPLRTRVRLALSGWTPDRTLWGPLVRQSPRVAPVYLVGYAEFPMRFRTTVRYASVPNRNR